LERVVNQLGVELVRAGAMARKPVEVSDVMIQRRDEVFGLRQPAAALGKAALLPPKGEMWTNGKLVLASRLASKSGSRLPQSMWLFRGALVASEA
jgi:hypothetical protein